MLWPCIRFSGGRGREVPQSAGTHRGHNKMFLAAPRTPSSASVFLWFVRVTFSHPAFTAVTRVQIPSGTPDQQVMGRISTLCLKRCPEIMGFASIQQLHESIPLFAVYNRLS